MKKLFYPILSLLVLTSCNDWFDVKSSSEIRKSDHYKNVQGFQQTLIGCYIAMADANLYGSRLSWHATEIMAHQFEKSTDVTLRALYEHSYRSTETNTIFEQVWASAYNVIVNVNDALEALEERKTAFDPIDYALLRGEFLAVRAYVHFDLLRLYGYGNWANRKAELDAKLTLPYVTVLSKNLTPQSTGAQFYNSLIKDIEEAAALLKENDPVTKLKSAADFAVVNSDGFYRHRNLHLNYYAVRGLQARVHQWIGSPEAMAKALEAATEVVEFVDKGGFTSAANEFYTTINFITSDKLTSAVYNLFPEALFGVQVQELESKIKSFFIPEFNSENSVAFQILPDRVNQIYESQNTDVRFSKLLHQSSSTTRGYVPMKFTQQEELSQDNRNRLSLLRIPEVYYIAAEAQLAQGATAEAVKLLNVVRQKRGLFTPLDSNLSAEEVKKEIEKEYTKEFIAEGVMFFYHKRLGTETLYGNADGEKMDDKRYVVPFPYFELQSGRVQ